MDPNTFISAVVSVAVVFFMLPGVAAVSIAATNLIKEVLSIFGKSIDGYSARIAGLLSLALFGTLVYFQVMRPDLSLVFLDERAAAIAQTLVILTGFVGQLLMQGPIHNRTRGSLPGVTASYSHSESGTVLSALRKRTDYTEIGSAADGPWVQSDGETGGPAQDPRTVTVEDIEKALGDK